MISIHKSQSNKDDIQAWVSVVEASGRSAVVSLFLQDNTGEEIFVKLFDSDFPNTDEKI